MYSNDEIKEELIRMLEEHIQDRDIKNFSFSGDPKEPQKLSIKIEFQ